MIPSPALPDAAAAIDALQREFPLRRQPHRTKDYDDLQVRFLGIGPGQAAAPAERHYRFAYAVAFPGVRRKPDVAVDIHYAYAAGPGSAAGAGGELPRLRIEAMGADVLGVSEAVAAVERFHHEEGFDSVLRVGDR